MVDDSLDGIVRNATLAALPYAPSGLPYAEGFSLREQTCRKLTIWIPKTLHRDLKREAMDSGVTVTQLAVRLLTKRQVLTFSSNATKPIGAT